MRRLRQPQWFKGGEVIIDIGSYIGADLVSFLRKAPQNVTVHTFEPVAAYRTKLARRVHTLVHSGRGRLHVHPIGLGRSNHTACFASKRAAATDEVSADQADSSNAAGSTCGAIRDAAATLQSFARVDIMQINCEGCEYDVLERLLEQPAVLQVVRSLEVQFHLDWGVQKNTSRYCRIESGLRSQGFRLDYRHPFLWERWARRPCKHDSGNDALTPSARVS
jgi:FkbM family methyltransferase